MKPKPYKSPTSIMTLWIAFGHMLQVSKMVSLEEHADGARRRLDDEELDALDQAIRKVEKWRG